VQTVKGQTVVREQKLIGKAALAKRADLFGFLRIVFGSRRFVNAVKAKITAALC